MAKKIREQRREQFLAMLNENELTPAAVAELLPEISVHTVTAWLKPETSKSSNPVPLWAVQLLTYKLKDIKNKRKR